MDIGETEREIEAPAPVEPAQPRTPERDPEPIPATTPEKVGV